MAKEKMVNAITARDEDFAQWYTDIVKKAELIDYSSVRGFVVYRPYAFAIWEHIQGIFDGMIKACGHQNVAMPLLIPESLLQKEKDHVAGFAPEVAWVTHGGSEALEERLCIRPTSETLFCEHWAHVLRSWRDLPMLYNQWCSVVRWEKSSRPFLRGREFLWQEGHTLHLDEKDARAEAELILGLYTRLVEDYLCVPVLRGVKTEREKFAGARQTLAIEAMMHDGKALQAGTSHYIGDNFARAFDITYSDRDNKLVHPHQTSWGVSTRLIGAIIMVHGDDNGLVLPPAVAPIQVMVVPVAQHKEGVLETAAQVAETLKAAGIRVKVDDSDNSPGWKYADCEMRGVPIRLELGPRDLEAGQCVLVRRDTGEKQAAPLEGLADTVRALLADYAAALFQRAKANLEANTVPARSIAEMQAQIADRPRFVKAMWCGDPACEEAVKEQTGMPSRCIPFEAEAVDTVCAVCGKPARHLVVYGVAY